MALENPIGLEDYRSAIPPQPIETLVKTEMAQTPQSFRDLFIAASRRLATDSAPRYFPVCRSPGVSALSATALTYDMIFNEPIRHVDC